MNYLRTAILLAGLTGLFMGVGYLIGGASGATIALVIAAATNLLAYWNSDRMVLSMYGAHEVDRQSAPELFDLVAELAGRAGLPMPRLSPAEAVQDKKRARLNTITHLLHHIPYEEIHLEKVKLPDRQKPHGYKEPDYPYKFVPEISWPAA